MNDKQDYSDIGERISSALKDAVETRDFGEINRVVTDTVNSAIDEVRRQVNDFSQAVNRQSFSEQSGSGTDTGKTADSLEGRKQSYSERYRYTYRQPGSRTMYASQKRPQGQNLSKDQSPVRTGGQEKNVRENMQTAPAQNGNTEVAINRVGRTGGILRVVFGSIGTGTFAVLGLVNLLVWAFKQTASAAVPVFVMALLCIVCGGFISKGLQILNRLKRAERYAKLGAKNRFLELEDIARNTGRSIKKVRSDIRRMLRLGIFPEGHMDKQETCLILDNETWQQYKLAQKGWENRKQVEDKKAKDSASAGQDAARDSQQNSEAQVLQEQQAQIIREGQSYMERLRELNIEIPGEIISNKLYQLDYLLTRIFAVVRAHPEKSAQMRKFMEYYLPTTVKLVESYADFDKVGVQGENITSAKEEIEKTMDTINQAFEKLLDDIYLNEAMETAADAQVLKTLLAQDGYTEKDFEIKG